MAISQHHEPIKSSSRQTKPVKPKSVQPPAATNTQASRRGSGASGGLLALQQAVGNRAIQRLLAEEMTGPALNIGPADDTYEQEADSVARQVTQSNSPAAPGLQTKPQPASQTVSRNDGGLPSDTRSFMENQFGADFSNVRLHTGSESMQLNRGMASEAFTQGRDVFLNTSSFNPASRGHQQLLAHELTHVVQQRGAAQTGGGMGINQSMPASRISTKRVKKHIDFIRMKRNETHITKMLLSKMGITKKPDDAYGHYWTEIGDLLNANDWVPVESYGWWPSEKGIGAGGALGGVPGVLNSPLHGGSSTKDPDHGDVAKTEFHPVMDVDSNADYEQIRADVINRVRSFAFGFKGSWNWRLGWGKNCQTFQKRLKETLGLHFQKGNGWLRRPEGTSLHQDDAVDFQTEKEDEVREASRPKNMIRVPVDYMNSEDTVVGTLPKDTLIELTGSKYEGQHEIMLDGIFYWVKTEELRAALAKRGQAAQTNTDPGELQL